MIITSHNCESVKQDFCCFPYSTLFLHWSIDLFNSYTTALSSIFVCLFFFLFFWQSRACFTFCWKWAFLPTNNLATSIKWNVQGNGTGPGIFLTCVLWTVSMKCSSSFFWSHTCADVDELILENRHFYGLNLSFCSQSSPYIITLKWSPISFH